MRAGGRLFVVAEFSRKYGVRSTAHLIAKRRDDIALVPLAAKQNADGGNSTNALGCNLFEQFRTQDGRNFAKA